VPQRLRNDFEDLVVLWGVTPSRAPAALQALIVLVLTFALNVASAKSFRFDSITQDVYLQANGTVRVEDVRVFRFEVDSGENFKRAFLEIIPNDGGNVAFQGVDVLDGKPGGSYTVDGNKITWGSPAQNETRKFRVRYTLTNELEVAKDAALFDRRTLEDTHKPVGVYTVRVHAPANSPERFKVFIFTDNSRIGTLNFDAGKRVATTVLKSVSEDEAVRLRVILAGKIFSSRTIQDNRYEQWMGITRSETRDFRDASRKIIENSNSAQNNGGFFTAPPPPPINGWFILAPWGVLAALSSGLLGVYERFGREPKVQDIGKYFREPAEQIPPGVVPFVLTQSDPGVGAAGTAISATILDLARRGHLEFVKARNEGFFGLGASDETHYRLVKPLTAQEGTTFERELYRILDACATGDQTVTPEALKSYFQSSSTRLSNWVAQPRAWYEEKFGDLLDPSGGKGWALVIPAVLLGGASIFGGFVLVGSLERAEVGVSVMFAGILLVLGAIFTGSSLAKWNPEKLLNARKWLAYRNFLADFSQMETAPSEHYKLWDYHFCYAAALGVADKYLANIGKLMERDPTRFGHAPWIMYGHGYGNPGSNLSDLQNMIQNVNSLTQITQNLSNLERSLDSSSSSGGGFGGSSMGGSSGGGGSSGAE
jgi:uncharacterized membrane protein